MGYATHDTSLPFFIHHLREHEYLQVFFKNMSVGMSSGYRL